MKHILTYRVFESLPGNPLGIAEFLEGIDLPGSKRDRVIEWWTLNRAHIGIQLFNFTTPMIMGSLLGTDLVAINAAARTPAHFKLFLALHESRHCDQHLEERLMDGYFHTVVRGEHNEFLRAYRELEQEANDFAIQAMQECGFAQQMAQEERGLRANEQAGPLVYEMMRRDIQRYQPVDLIDLISQQIF